MNNVVEFKKVYKHYPFYHHITGGFKNLLFNLPKAIKEINTLKHQALIDVNLEIKKGEAVAFIGRNGAGKSTILGLIAQVLKPNQGQVIVGSRVSPLLELGGGFHPELSGVENIKLNGVLLGLSRKQVLDKLDRIISFSELGDFINHPIRTYSSGMLARLGFSVVAHLDPEILLIDEVLAVGDASFQQKCLKKIEEFKKDGVTIILVSHSTADVDQLTDRAIWVHDKKIKMDGPSKNVTAKYRDFFNLENKQISGRESL